MLVAITGATGFVGGHLARELARAGHQVRAVVRSPDKARGLVSELGAEVRKADLADADALQAALVGADAVVHNAALGSWSGELADYEAVNVSGTENLLDAMEATGLRRLVHISTVAVYRTRLWRAMDEQATPYGTARRWLNPSDLTTDWRYALTKSLAEARVFERALDTTVLRPGPVYGSGDPKLSAKLLAALDHPVRLAPTVGLPLVHAADVALAAVAALSAPRSVGQAYNLTGPPVALYRIMRELIELTGRGPRLVPVPVPVWVHYDTSAAERDLGWSPRALRAGLQELLATS